MSTSPWGRPGQAEAAALPYGLAATRERPPGMAPPVCRKATWEELRVEPPAPSLPEAAPLAAPLPTVLSFSEDELARACAAAAAQARGESRAEHEQAVKDAEARTVTRQVSLLESLLRQRAGEQHTLREHAMQIGIHLARLLAGRALAEDPLGPAADLLDELLPTLSAEASLVIEVRPEDAAGLEALIAKLAVLARFKGSLQVQPDPALSASDLRIRWDDGWAERSLARLEQAAGTALAALLPAATFQEQRP